MLSHCKSKTTRKFAVAKKIISPKDTRVNSNASAARRKFIDKKAKDEPRNIENVSSAMFFSHNTQLGPPYNVLVDTNFLNFSIRNKVSLV